MKWVTLLDMGKPESWITSQVGTDAFKTRQINLPREALSVSREGTIKRGTSGNTRLNEALRVAYESVVVMNLEPMNLGNKWEDKTQETPVHTGDIHRSKVCGWYEGMKKNQSG